MLCYNPHSVIRNILAHGVRELSKKRGVCVSLIKLSFKLNCFQMIFDHYDTKYMHEKPIRRTKDNLLKTKVKSTEHNLLVANVRAFMVEIYLLCLAIWLKSSSRWPHEPFNCMLQEQKFVSLQKKKQPCCSEIWN